MTPLTALGPLPKGAGHRDSHLPLCPGSPRLLPSSPRQPRLFEGRPRTSPSDAPAAFPREPRHTGPCGSAPRDSAGPSDGPSSVTALTWQNVALTPPPGRAHTFREARVVQGPSACCSLSREEALSQVRPGLPRAGAPPGWCSAKKHEAAAKPGGGAVTRCVRGSRRELGREPAERSLSLRAGGTVRLLGAPSVACSSRPQPETAFRAQRSRSA